jgi:hypothetical protein
MFVQSLHCLATLYSSAVTLRDRAVPVDCLAAERHYLHNIEEQRNNKTTKTKQKQNKNNK